MAYARIRLRRGTAYEWSTLNPILEEGEIALEYPDEGIGGLCKFKVGNGSDRWNTLGYAFDGTAASSIDGGTPGNFHVIKLRAGSSSDWANVDPVINKNELIYVTDKQGFKMGTGLDRWSELPYTKAAGFVDDEIDFGDEDLEEEIYGSRQDMFENLVEEGLDYPENVWDIPTAAPAPVESTASIDDILPAEEIAIENIENVAGSPDLDLDGGSVADEIGEDPDKRESEAVEELESLNKE